MTGERNQMLRSSSKAELLVKYATITTSETATVQSQSNDSIYHVNYKEGTCECGDSVFRGNYCKHQQAVDLKIMEDKSHV